jgi:hypothetical protein
MSSVNEIFHITISDTPESMEAGEYKATFVDMTGLHDGDHGPYYKLEFSGDNGRTFMRKFQNLLRIVYRQAR